MEISKLLDIFQTRVSILLPTALLLELVPCFYSCYFYFSFKPCLNLCGWQAKNNFNLKHGGTSSWVQTLIVTQTSKPTQNSDSTNSLKTVASTEDCCDLKRVHAVWGKSPPDRKCGWDTSPQRWEMECFSDPEQTPRELVWEAYPVVFLAQEKLGWEVEDLSYQHH